MLQTMLEAFNATAAWLLAAKAHLAEGKPLADIPGIEGDNDAARLKYLEERKAAHDAAKLDIDRMKAFLEADYQSSDTPGTVPPEDRRKTAPAPTEGHKAWAQAKSIDSIHPSIVEFGKAFADNQDFRDFAKDPSAKGLPGKSLDLGFMGVKAALMAAKTTITSVGAIQTVGAITATGSSAPQLLDICAFRPVAGDVYRSRLQANSAPSPTALDAGNETAAGITPVSHTVETILGTIPVANRMIDTDPSVVAATAEDLMRQARRSLEAQVTNGNNSSPNLNGLLRQLTGTNTSAAATATGGILTGTSAGVETFGGAKFDLGFNPTAIVGRGGNLVLFAQSLRKLGYTLLPTQSPFGSTLGMDAVLASQITADSAILGEFGNPDYHLIALKGEVVVESDYSREFELDNTVLRVKLYAANVLIQPNAFYKFTNTDEWILET